MVPSDSLVIVCESGEPARRAFAQAWAERLGAPMITQADAANGATLDPARARPWHMVVRDDGVELLRHDRDGRRRSALRGLARPARLRIDLAVPRGSALTRSQPLAKAMGKDARVVIDATAGLGQDSALLASAGYDVVMIERSPVLAMLHDDACARLLARQHGGGTLAGRIHALLADARTTLAHPKGLPPSARRPDVVYLDPMFPPKRRASALPKRELVLLRELVGDDDDAAELLNIARRAAPRVVVKRPDHAPPLAEDVAVSFPGKLVRYDVYSRAAEGARG